METVYLPLSLIFQIIFISAVNKIKIYDANGALVNKIENYQVGELIDLYRFSQGVYFFHIEDDKHNVIKKIIKI